MTAGTQIAMQSDGALFAREVLGFAADERQAALLREAPERLILNCTRQWGKSTLTAAAAVHHAWSRPEAMVLVASPSERQSAEMVRKARRFAARVVKVRGDGENRRSVLLPNGSRIVGVPSGEDTVVGFSAVTLLVVDEAARVPDGLWEAVTPMLATSKGSIWLLSTREGEAGVLLRRMDAGRRFVEAGDGEGDGVSAYPAGVPGRRADKEDGAAVRPLFRLPDYSDRPGRTFANGAPLLRDALPAVGII